MKTPKCSEIGCNKLAVRISTYDRKSPICFSCNMQTLKCISILKDYSKKEIKKILKKGHKIYIKNLKKEIKGARNVKH